jgi:hypothetical protein
MLLERNINNESPGTFIATKATKYNITRAWTSLRLLYQDTCINGE